MSFIDCNFLSILSCFTFFIFIITINIIIFWVYILVALTHWPSPHFFSLLQWLVGFKRFIHHTNISHFLSYQFQSVEDDASLESINIYFFFLFVTRVFGTKHFPKGIGGMVGLLPRLRPPAEASQKLPLIFIPFPLSRRPSWLRSILPCSFRMFFFLLFLLSVDTIGTAAAGRFPCT